MTVFDGPSTTSTQLGQYSGNSLPVNLTSTGSFMLVRFTSNAVNALTGFTATETFVPATCSGTRFISTSGTLISDGFGDYQPNMNCTWNITAPADQLVTLNFSSFSSEANSDLLLIYDVSVNGFPYLVANYSGTSLPPLAQSLGNAIIVVWTTNAAVQLGGFDAVVTFVNVPACSASATVTTPGSIISDGTGNYGNSASCSWLVTAPVGYVVNLAFLTFNTESGRDFVNIYDGTSALATLLGSRSGTALPAPSRSSNRNLFLTFTSDTSVVNIGFTAAVTFAPYQCNGTSVIASDGVQFYSSTGPYLNNVVWWVPLLFVWFCVIMCDVCVCVCVCLVSL